MDVGENAGYEKGKLTKATEDKTARLLSETFLGHLQQADEAERT